MILLPIVVIIGMAFLIRWQLALVCIAIVIADPAINLLFVSYECGGSGSKALTFGELGIHEIFFDDGSDRCGDICISYAFSGTVVHKLVNGTEYRFYLDRHNCADSTLLEDTPAWEAVIGRDKCIAAIPVKFGQYEFRETVRQEERFWQHVSITAEEIERRTDRGWKIIATARHTSVRTIMPISRLLSDDDEKECYVSTTLLQTEK
ncbi:MAG TPA: hypothetical protein VM639_13190 [Dongiaceae bacterium]|nr:hypothetical protein [Dongiaceae bacterium]